MNNFKLLYFKADWCASCVSQLLLVKSFAKEKKIELEIVSVESNEDIAELLEVRSLPTIILFKNAKEVEKQVGTFNKERMENVLNGN